MRERWGADHLLIAPFSQEQGASGKPGMVHTGQAEAPRIIQKKKKMGPGQGIEIMSKAFGPQTLFVAHPDPMWIYDVETLAVLDVNRAALQAYRHTRAEFLALAADEISPDILRNIEPVPGHPQETTRHRRQRANGEPIDLDVTAERFEFAGRPAMLVVERDVTRLVQLEDERAAARQREAQSRQDAEVAARNFLALFEAMPGRYLVIKPENFEIVAVSDSYLDATMTTRADLNGRSVFDVFPDDPGDPASDGARNIRASLERVASLGLTDILPLQRCPIRTPGAAAGQYQERFWSIVNTPMKGPDGSVTLIINRVEDVTDLVRSTDLAGGELAAIQKFEERTLIGLHILLRSEELKQTNSRLLEQDANLRTAQKLLNIGIWKLNMDSGELTWSDEVYKLYGVKRGEFDNTFDGYVGLVFPDDRKDMVANYERFVASGEVHFEFEHRVGIAGRIIRLRGGAELTETAEGRVLTGVVQDITALAERDIQLTQASALLGLAGRAAQLGGWRLDLNPERLTWTPQVAAIHGEPEGFTPTVEEGLAYYHPDHREQITAALDACVKNGVPFDETLRLVTAAGEDIWVRAIGEAEYDTDRKIVAVQGAFQNVSDLVRARSRIDEVSRRLAQTLESMSDGFFTLDCDWRFTYLNSEAERLFSSERAQLLHQVIWEAFPETLDTAFIENYRQVAESGEPARFTAFHGPSDKWFSVSAYRTEEGLAVQFRDATLDRARSQQLLLLEAAVSRLNDILLITEADPIGGPDGPKIVYVNDAFVRLTGYSQEEAIGQTPRILQGPETNRRELDRIREALKDCRPIHAEVVNYSKGGDSYILELDIAPIKNADGIVSHFVAVERDVTERKRNEEELRRAQESVVESERIQRSLALALAEETERLNFAQTVAGVGSWETDLESYRVTWSRALHDIFGLRPDQFDGTHKGFLKLVHPDDRKAVDDAFVQSLDNDKVIHKIDHRIVTSNGSIRTVSERWKVLRNPNGQPQRVTGTTHDISERVELEEMLRQSQKLEAIGQLTGGVAHDFNNLLTVILGNAELLEEALAYDPKLRQLADMSVQAAERGADLSNRLLAFSRRQSLHPKAVDVRALIEQLEALLRRAVGEQVEIRTVSDDTLWSALIDAPQLENALLNLCVNARDAMPDGGRLTIEAENVELDSGYIAAGAGLEPGEYVVVSVSDTGTGMDEHTMRHAFDPFFTTKEVGRGSGLGLSMVYGFVKQSKGHVKIYSELGQGTTIKLYLPRAIDGTAGFEPPKEAATAPRGVEKILVVEDDELVRGQVAAQLKLLGYDVVSAGDGIEALALLKRIADFDLLFTDIIMPRGLNGRQLADEALKLHPSLAVLFTSGYTEKAFDEQTNEGPRIPLLSKPYRRHDLAERVRSALDGRKSA